MKGKRWWKSYLEEEEGGFECVGGRDKEVEAETRDACLDDTWYFCTLYLLAI